MSVHRGSLGEGEYQKAGRDYRGVYSLATLFGATSVVFHRDKRVFEGCCCIYTYT